MVKVVTFCGPGVALTSAYILRKHVHSSLIGCATAGSVRRWRISYRTQVDRRCFAGSAIGARERRDAVRLTAGVVAQVSRERGLASDRELRQRELFGVPGEAE